MVGPLVGAAGIGAASSLASGILGMFGANSARDMQMRAAQNAIQWRVRDAKKAGIHPIYALGASGAAMPAAINTFAPVAEGISEMGQNVGRALLANSSNEMRSDAMTKLTIENMGLQNDLLRSQIGKINSAQLGPGVPAVLEEVVPERPSSGRPMLLAGGSRINTDPFTSSAQDFEDRYGDSEIAQMLFGALIGARDLKASYDARGGFSASAAAEALRRLGLY